MSDTDNTCATCAHWTRNHAGKLPTYGTCAKGIGERNVTGSTHYTQQAFGCVLHEEAPDWARAAAEEYISGFADHSEVDVEELAAIIRKHAPGGGDDGKD